MPVGERHAIKTVQEPTGFFSRSIRIDLALELEQHEIAALVRTRRKKAVVLTFTPIRRWYHWRAPADRVVTAGDLIEGKFASFTVPAKDASTIEIEIRKKCRAFLQQIVDATAAGSVRRYDLDNGKLMGR